jgi:hypothetical protein
VGRTTGATFESSPLLVTGGGEMASNPTLVEPGKIVELNGSIYKIESIYRDRSGELKSFLARVLLRDLDEDQDDAGSTVGLEVYDEELLSVYTIH